MPNFSRSDCSLIRDGERAAGDELTYRHSVYMSRHMPERTTVRLPEDLLKRAKRKAAAEGRTLTALIEDGLRRVLAESRKTGPAKRTLPPVSTAKGGPMPGVDFSRFSALQELDDLDAVDRMNQPK